MEAYEVSLASLLRLLGAQEDSFKEKMQPEKKVQDGHHHAEITLLSHPDAPSLVVLCPLSSMVYIGLCCLNSNCG